MKNSKFKSLFILVIILLVGLIGTSGYIVYEKLFKQPGETKNYEVKKKTVASSYRLKGNSLEDFDLYFLQLENNKKNMIYSPLSIKYALEMLNEGTGGASKEQISNILGTYNGKKYTNSKNMSLANALFVKDSFKDLIKDSYTNTIANKYNAEVIYDSFVTPDNLNLWVKNKTLNLIPNLFDNINNLDYILANALAIDMEWVKRIQSLDDWYSIEYAHRKRGEETFSVVIDPLNWTDYYELDFANINGKTKSVKIAAVANKYDIVNILGEENIRKTVGDAYKKWLADENTKQMYGSQPNVDIDKYLDEYIKEIDKGYLDISGSTDFSFYTDNDVKIFSKDLKEYDGTTLQYIGIMPTKEDLDNYIKNIKAEKINNLINNLKEIKLDSFKDNIITIITGYIPMFNFEYELGLKEDLAKLGITDVFDCEKANLSNLTTAKGSYISKSLHKANIEFSNDGIKAAAATALGGAGGCDEGFDYLYEVPIEEIDLTFDKPYLFLIRDKDSGEVWFTGMVYEPSKWQSIEMPNN